MSFGDKEEKEEALVPTGEKDQDVASLILSGINDGFAELLHTGSGLDASFTKDIRLKRQSIVGMRYQGGSDDLMKELQPGTRIGFVREASNRFDENAVMALDPQGRKLGYIPRHENDIIGALLDAGKYIYGVVTDNQMSGYYAPGTQMTPAAVFVDLYMQEYTRPDAALENLRQGSRGSYAVAEFVLAERCTKIGEVFVIKVINGEERDILHRELQADDPEAYRQMIRSFQEFIGNLPLVCHGVLEDALPILEEAYGVQLGLPFSNHVIDTEQMAENHLPFVKNRTLDGFAECLGIPVQGESELEERARAAWKLYCRMDRSELDHVQTTAETIPRTTRISRKSSNEYSASSEMTDSNKNDQARRISLDMSIEKAWMPAALRDILRENRILTIRELTRYTEEELVLIHGLTYWRKKELMVFLQNAGLTLRPNSVDRALYGFPERIRRIEKEKGPFWDSRLFVESFIVYWRWLEPVRMLKVELWHPGIEVLSLTNNQYFAMWMQDRVLAVKNLVGEFKELTTCAIDNAMHTFALDQTSVIMQTVDDLMDFYKKIQLWRQSFSCISAPKELRSYVEKLLRGVSEGFLDSYEQLLQECLRVSEELEEVIAGRLDVDQVDMTLSVHVDMQLEDLLEDLEDFEI